jgi:hypothetical protein
MLRGAVHARDAEICKLAREWVDRARLGEMRIGINATDDGDAGDAANASNAEWEELLTEAVVNAASAGNRRACEYLREWLATVSTDRIADARLRAEAVFVQAVRIVSRVRGADRSDSYWTADLVCKWACDAFRVVGNAQSPAVHSAFEQLRRYKGEIEDDVRSLADYAIRGRLSGRSRVAVADTYAIVRWSP